MFIAFLLLLYVNVSSACGLISCNDLSVNYVLLKFSFCNTAFILVFVSSQIIKLGLTYLKHITLNVANFIFHTQEL